MTDLEKKKYNREHYLKNKEVILSKAKTRYRAKGKAAMNVISLFETTDAGSKLPPKQNREKRRKWMIPWSLAPLLLLVGLITGFLFSETARFYSEFDGSSGSAYLKAFILEGAVLAFSLLKGHTAMSRFLYRLMVVLIYSYSIWVVSGGVIQKALHQRMQFEQNRKIVSELEDEISKKTDVRDTYLSVNRITLGMKVDQSLSDFRQKLERSRDVLGQSPSVSVIWNTLFTLVVFRVLVMVSNLLFLQDLGRRFRLKGRVI